MKRKLIIASIVGVGIGAILILPNDKQEQLNLTTPEEQPVSNVEPQQSEQEPVEQARHPFSSEQQQNEATESPAQPQDTQEPVQEPFDAQSYAQVLIAERTSQGYAVDASCFNNLMFEAYGWQMTKQEVDQAFKKVTTYSSTCAAYAQFKTKGSY